MFYAHSENSQHIKHALKDHLHSTAEIAQSFSPSAAFEDLFYLAGLVHDVGKFQDGFQKYLFEGGGKTPHAGIGAYIASTYGKQLLPLQFVIKGHHAGLPENEQRKQNNDEYAHEEQVVGVVGSRFMEVAGDSVERANAVRLHTRYFCH